MIIGGVLGLLLLVADALEGSADALLPVAILQVQDATGMDSVEEGRIFKWEQDLRRFAFHLLKDVRRYGIRIARWFWRSADYWLRWLAAATGLLFFGGLVSAVDRRLIALARERGTRLAMVFATIGLVVFLRLLRDRRIPPRVRGVIPLALLYGIAASYWLDDWSLGLSLANEIAAICLAARWFVQRCPDEIVEQHAHVARERALARMVLPSSEQRSS